MTRGRLLSIVGLYGVLCLAALPLALGWVPPNRWYGFLRLPAVRRNPEWWYEINELGGRLFLAAMLICLALNLLIYWWGPETIQRQMIWINGAFILMSFWLISLELVQRIPG